MIYIVDDGFEYSGHSVWFIEAEPCQMDPVLACLDKALPRDKKHPHLIAKAKSLDWYAGRPMTFREGVDKLHLVICDKGDDAIDQNLFRELCKLCEKGDSPENTTTEHTSDTTGSDAWINFESQGGFEFRQYRAQLAGTGLIIEKRRCIPADDRVGHSGSPVVAWKQSDPPQWDPVRSNSLDFGTARSALAGKLGIHRRHSSSKGRALRNERAATVWIHRLCNITVTQGRLLLNAVYSIIDARVWIETSETIERLYWHKRELANWKDPNAVYQPWVDLQPWILVALKSSQKTGRWTIWHECVSRVNRLGRH